MSLPLWERTKLFMRTNGGSMKIYLAQGESRSFEFSAIGLTEAEAEHAIKETFKAHARHYGLPLDWWKENADYFIMEMETGNCYRDRSLINHKWYYDTEEV